MRQASKILGVSLIIAQQLPIAAFAQTVQTSTDATLLTEARAAFQAHDLQRAEAVTRSALQASPRSAGAMYLLAHVLEGCKQAKESLEWFTRAAATSPPSGEDLRVVALDYVLLDDSADALRWLKRSVELAPDNAEAWYDLGRAEMMESHVEAAEAPFQRALALEPRMAKAENNLGVVYEEENRPVEAAAAYLAAIDWGKAESHPSEQPFLNYGGLLLTQQHGDQALPFLQKALAIAPDDVKCNEQLARALDQQGDHAQAILRMRHAVDLAPREARLHFELGQIYKRDGQTEEAKKELALSGQLYGSHSTDSVH